MKKIRNSILIVCGVCLLLVGDYSGNYTRWFDSITTSKKYYYSGYAQGNGNNETEESTLSLLTDKLDALELDVKSTYYRLPYIKNAQGTEQECVIDAQDTLHSVYFSVCKSLHILGGITLL